MKVLVVLESIFGNTRDIAEAIAAGLRDGGHTADVVEAGAAVDAARAGRAVDSDADVVVVGGPTHVWSMSRDRTRADARRQAGEHGVAPVSPAAGVREWIDVVAPTLRTRRAATFDTSMATRLPSGSAARRAAAALRKRGFVIEVAPAQFRVVDTGGPLVDGEAARARRWGLELAARLSPSAAASAP